jgi:hypothetical protein
MDCGIAVAMETGKEKLLISPPGLSVSNLLRTTLTKPQSLKLKLLLNTVDFACSLKSHLFIWSSKPFNFRPTVF